MWQPSKILSTRWPCSGTGKVYVVPVHGLCLGRERWSAGERGRRWARPLEGSSGPARWGPWRAKHLPPNVIFELLDSELVLLRLPPPGFLLLGISSGYTLQQPFFPKHFGLREWDKRRDVMPFLAHSLPSLHVFALHLLRVGFNHCFHPSLTWLFPSIPSKPSRATRRIYCDIFYYKKNLKMYRNAEETVKWMPT